jgi:Rieske Fe-S protein
MQPRPPGFAKIPAGEHIMDEPACRDCQHSRRSLLRQLLGAAGALAAGVAFAGCQRGPTDWRKLTYYPVNYLPQNSAVEITIGGHAAYLIHGRLSDTHVVVAVDRRCTHAGCLVSYDRSTLTLRCPCHGSVYNMQGEPVNGPALRPLKRYKIEFDGENFSIDPAQTTHELTTLNAS